MQYRIYKHLRLGAYKCDTALNKIYIYNYFCLYPNIPDHKGHQPDIHGIKDILGNKFIVHYIALVWCLTRVVLHDDAIIMRLS